MWVEGWEILQNELSGVVGKNREEGNTFLSNSPTSFFRVKNYFFCYQTNFLSPCVFAITSMLFSNHYVLALFPDIYYLQCLFLGNNI